MTQPHQTFQDATRRGWGSSRSDECPSHEKLLIGALLRIAEALETLTELTPSEREKKENLRQHQEGMIRRHKTADRTRIWLQERCPDMHSNTLYAASDRVGWAYYHDDDGEFRPEDIDWSRFRRLTPAAKKHLKAAGLLNATSPKGPTP